MASRSLSAHPRAEGADRYERLLSRNEPTLVAQFVERVPMVKGRWDPEASTATSYAWVLWTRGHQGRRGGGDEPSFTWIPPGQRGALTRPDDARRFAVQASAPLLTAAE